MSEIGGGSGGVDGVVFVFGLVAKYYL